MKRGVSEGTGLDRGGKGENCTCRYKITSMRVTRKVDDIEIRKEEIRKAKLPKGHTEYRKG